MKYIRKWLSEFRSLPEPASIRYFETMKFNNELVEELHHMFSDLDSEKTCQLLDPVCHQLFNCYKSNVSNLRNFALEFIPAVIWSYFNLLKSSKQQLGGITAFLLGVYNLGPNEISQRCVPSVFQASMYHEPPFFSSILLTESALKNRHNLIGHMTSPDIPPKKFDSITSQNRNIILGFAVKVYLSNISLMSFRSCKNLCTLCSRLSRMGLDIDSEMSPVTMTSSSKFSTIQENSKERQRCLFQPELVVELLCGMQFLMFNGLARNAIRAIEDVHFRASYDLQPEILVVTNALLNLSESSDAMKDDKTVLSVTPAHSFKNHPPISKDAITNASFRPKKLPDDIDVQDKNEYLQADITQSSGEPCEDQTLDNEKSPQVKIIKPQQTAKPSQKKEKTSKMHKFKENEVHSSSKRISSGVVYNSDVEGIQLKAIKQNIMEFPNLNEVGYKSKSIKLAYTGNDDKTPATTNSPLPDSSNETSDARSPMINLLSQSTFL